MKKIYSPEEAKQIGDQLGIDWKEFDVDQFRKGLIVEMEHGSSISELTNVTHDDPILTGKIALAHLLEIPDYYDRLEEMEEEGEEFWEGKREK